MNKRARADLRILLDGASPKAGSDYSSTPALLEEIDVLESLLTGLISNQGQEKIDQQGLAAVLRQLGAVGAEIGVSAAESLEGELIRYIGFMVEVIGRMMVEEVGH